MRCRPFAGSTGSDISRNGGISRRTEPAGPPALIARKPQGGKQPKRVFGRDAVGSGFGKGIPAASLGRLFKSRGLRVTLQKLDPYINVDPGTMNPFEHGEVFVLDDGAET